MDGAVPRGDAGSRIATPAGAPVGYNARSMRT